MRMGDCKEELHALLQEDVSKQKAVPHVDSQSVLALGRGVVVGIC